MWFQNLLFFPRFIFKELKREIFHCTDVRPSMKATLLVVALIINFLLYKAFQSYRVTKFLENKSRKEQQILEPHPNSLHLQFINSVRVTGLKIGRASCRERVLCVV